MRGWIGALVVILGLLAIGQAFVPPAWGAAAEPREMPAHEPACRTRDQVVRLMGEVLAGYGPAAAHVWDGDAAGNGRLVFFVMPVGSVLGVEFRGGCARAQRRL